MSTERFDAYVREEIEETAALVKARVISLNSHAALVDGGTGLLAQPYFTRERLERRRRPTNLFNRLSGLPELCGR